MKTPFSSASLTFRSTVFPEDILIVRDILVSTGFFYDIEIPVALELVEEKLADEAASSYQFIFAEREGRTIAYSCFGLIPGTEQSFDLYWIATHNDYRGQGIGRLLLEETHRVIAAQHGLNVIAETSSLVKYEPTRRFYQQMGYQESGLIPDYYKQDDAKVTFVKRLAPSA